MGFFLPLPQTSLVDDWEPPFNFLDKFPLGEFIPTCSFASMN